MGSVAVHEVSCASALNRVRGMPFEWSINPYRGCAHACTYCYAREYFAKMGRDPLRGFDREVEVRSDIAQRLRHELAKRPRGSVAIGTATDPYQPVEGRFRLTRACLESFHLWPMPLVLITKGTLAVRDADVLASLSRYADVRLVVSIGSVDREVARQLEPSAPPPAQRLRMLRLLRVAGVKASVICAPIVPGVSDSAASIEAVARAALEHGAYGFSHRVLKIDPGVREGFMASIAAWLPALVPRYEARYTRVHLDPEYARTIDARVARIHARYRFPADTAADAPPAQDGLQLQLAL